MSLELIFVEPEILEVGEADLDPRRSLRAVICSPGTTRPTVEFVGVAENAPGDGEYAPLHG